MTNSVSIISDEIDGNVHEIIGHSVDGYKGDARPSACVNWQYGYSCEWSNTHLNLIK